MQTLESLFPLIPIHQVIPVGDDVPERTALEAERNPTIHAASALSSDLLLAGLEIDLSIIVDALRNGTFRRGLPLELHEARDLAHQ
jgi:hypothetical protein